jgi:hypothetical protein
MMYNNRMKQHYYVNVEQPTKKNWDYSSVSIFAVDEKDALEKAKEFGTDVSIKSGPFVLGKDWQ